MKRRQLLATAALCPWLRAWASDWPSKTLRIIVPGGPGGVIDIRARWIAQRLAVPLRLYQALHEIPDSAEAKEWFGAIGAKTGDEPPEALARDIRAEHAKWGQMIREAGIRLE